MTITSNFIRTLHTITPGINQLTAKHIGGKWYRYFLKAYNTVLSPQNFHAHGIRLPRCASGRVVECRICNREVAGSNLGLGYFAPRSTHLPLADERVGVQVKLWNPLRTRAIPERLRWWFTTKRRCIKCMHLYMHAPGVRLS